MNKKVSTLVAALMAAGALVLPKDVFAQLTYQNGLDYSKQTSVKTVDAGDYCLVFNEDGIDYVAVVKTVDSQNKLVAVPFAEADKNDFFTISAVSGSNGNIHAVKTGNVQLGIDVSNQNWHSAGNEVKVAISSSKPVISRNNGTNNAYVTLTEGVFGVKQSAKSVQLNAKLLSTADLKVASLEGVEYYNSANLTNGANVILVFGDKVLEEGEDKKVSLQSYDSENNAQVWTVVYDANVPNKPAYFKNLKSGNVLKNSSDATVTINASTQYTIPAKGIAGLSVSNPNIIKIAKVSVNYNVNASELNAWYNEKGFNFKVNGKNVEGNLFGGDNVVYAHTNEFGHSLPGGIYIPRGTYFFTDVKFLNGKGANGATTEDIDWKNSTLIAVSSTESKEATVDPRSAGNGFILVEKLGTSFDFQNYDYEEGKWEKPKGDDLSIYNAAFTVNKQASQSYPYEISLYNFWYQAKSSNYSTVEQVNKPVKIAVETYNNEADKSYVVTEQTYENKFIFDFTNSAVLNTRTLLKETKEAAVYTIKFVEGVEGQEDLMGKYLTYGFDDDVEGDIRYQAKPEAIFDSSMPIYQWVITNVSDGEKNDKGEMVYKKVTFRNRETGWGFTTSLFAEENGLYSINAPMNVLPYSINKELAQNTYEVKPADKVVEVNSNVLIQLTPVEVDAKAGYLDVEDGAIRTIAFARDKYTTSNRLYASVVADKTGKELNADNKFITEVSEAAQWQFVKAGEEVLSRVFVYNNTKTQSADEAVETDDVKVNVYALRYVEDGAATNYFLSNEGVKDLVSISSYKDIKDLTDVTKFFIKENVDGSVSLIKYRSLKDEYDGVNENNATKVLEVALNTNKDGFKYIFDQEYVYESESGTNDIRTFLDPEHKEISWEGPSHATIRSEEGDYITMNDHRDAIVVNETTADVFYLYQTDDDAIVPSFYITKGIENSKERNFLFNPTDSVNYYVAEGQYDREYQWSEDMTKVMFKPATINESLDTLTINVKGETKYIAEKADNNNKDVWGGLKRFKFQIVETEDADGLYYIRQVNATDNPENTLEGTYLASWNEKLIWTTKNKAMKFKVEKSEAPTSNEGVSATEVKVVAQDGSVVVKNAAGKNVVVSTILGQVVANEVVTSDNATINVPAGIVVVAVEGESFKVNVK